MKNPNLSGTLVADNVQNGKGLERLIQYAASLGFDDGYNGRPDRSLRVIPQGAILRYYASAYRVGVRQRILEKYDLTA